MCWHYNKQELQRWYPSLLFLTSGKGFGRLAPSTAIAPVGPPQSCEFWGGVYDVFE